VPPRKQGKYRFTDFEIDLARRTLSRNGHTIALGPSTFDLLTLLLAHAQRVVAKEELMRALGPDATVEESNLAQHIFLLQKALSGIDPGEKLILRIPGLGYKFTAQVTQLPPDPEPNPFLEPAPNLDPEPESLVTAVPLREESPQIFPRFASYNSHEPSEPAKSSRHIVEPDSASEAESDSEPQPSLAARLNRPLPITALGLLIVLIAAGALYAWRRVHTPSPAAGAAPQSSLRLIPASFENSTGEPVFDRALKTALTLDLQQSPYLSVPPEALVDQPLDALKSSDLQPASPAAASQLCRQLNAEVYLSANLRRLTHNYLVTVKAFDCSNQRDMAESRGIADSPDTVVSVLDKVAADLRQQLGEPRASVTANSKPLFSDRPASIAALKAYADAGALQLQGKYADALQLFQRAVFLDPKFALAYADIAALEESQGHTAESKSALSKAYLLRETVDDQHRYILTAAFHDQITGDLPAALRNDKQWAAQYPRNPVPLTHQASLEIELGASVLALEPARRALALNPGNPAAYIVLARAQMHLGQFEEAAATCQQAIQHQLDSVEIHQFLLQIAFLRLDQPAIDEQLAWARSKPADSQAATQMQLQQAEIAFAEGRATAAKAIVLAVADQYHKQNQPDLANQIQSRLPRILAELGYADSANTQLGRLTNSDAPEIPVTWAYLGETTKAEAILTRQLAANPIHTLWQQSWAPQIRAAIALNRHEPQAAIDTLAPNNPSDQINFDLGSFDIPALRGKAYLALKQPEKAETEFHKILDHPGIQPLSHNYPLAQLGLARSLAAQGKTTEAGFAYKIVLQIWKEADPELARLKEAKAEYTRLGAAPLKPVSKPNPRKK